MRTMFECNNVAMFDWLIDWLLIDGLCWLFRSPVWNMAEHVREIPRYAAGLKRARVLLRRGDERVLLRSRSGHIPTHPQLLPHREVALPQARMPDQVFISQQHTNAYIKLVKSHQATQMKYWYQIPLLFWLKNVKKPWRTTVQTDRKDVSKFKSINYYNRD